MNFLQQKSIAAGGVFIVLSPEDCKTIDNSIDRAIENAFKRGLEAAKAIAQLAQEKPLKQSYSFKEISEMFGICRTTIYNWEKAGIIKTSGVGNKRYVTGESVKHIQELMNPKVYSR